MFLIFDRRAPTFGGFLSDVNMLMVVAIRSSDIDIF